MNGKIVDLIEKLNLEHRLSSEEYQYLLENKNEEAAAVLKEKSIRWRKEVYGTQIYIRGLIEYSNICKNDCYYCGIRRSNRKLNRFRLSLEDILSCCEKGYDLGFRTFVLQGGEDDYFTDDRMCEIVSDISSRYPDCAITLSMGERSLESYQHLYEAGATRYLLRHETACEEHYRRLHPEEMSYNNRMTCLENLKKIGYQVGCGFMVGSPFQSFESMSKDLTFIQDFQPDMCGIGPFIPQKDTPFGKEKMGTLDMTCYLLSIIRLIKPNILLPATTALGTIHPKGRNLGILAGANVIMPNLSPENTRKDYALYDNKLNTGLEDSNQISELKEEMKKIGYDIVIDRGDIRN